jgi:hypothetical protein
VNRNVSTPEGGSGADTRKGCHFQTLFHAAIRDGLSRPSYVADLVETATGKLASPPEPGKAQLVANRPRDQLMVTKLDRLGRSPRASDRYGSIVRC